MMTPNASTKAMALADGQLDPAELPALVHEMARDADLMAEMQGFLAMSRARLAEPYSNRGAEPPPDWLVQTVMHADIGTGSGGHPVKPLTYVRELFGRLSETRHVQRWSLAAGPALAAAVVALGAWLLMPAQSQSNALMAAQLQNALEKTPSGVDMPMLAFRPTLTYWSKDQTWCRQFEARYDGIKQSVAAVACRTGDGNWRVARQAPPVPLGPTPAGGAREDLDRFVGSSMDGPPLERAEVEEKIGNGWRPRQ
jgi:hypothetical protein